MTAAFLDGDFSNRRQRRAPVWAIRPQGRLADASGHDDKVEQAEL